LSGPAGATCGRFLPLPGVRSGKALFEAQLGTILLARSPSRIGSGVLEIRKSIDGDAYRAVYTVRFEGVLYVLHAFQKKSTKGIATPKLHLDLIKAALAPAETIHRASQEGRS